MGHDLVDQYTHVRVTEREREREKGAERISEEIMAENFPNLMKEMYINIQEAQGTQRMVNAKRPTLRHIISKLSKVKDKGRVSKAEERSKSSHKGTSIRLSANFS